MASARGQVLDLAILGRLRHAAMHGYQLRKQLNATLGAFRTLSYGSLYPALRSLTDRGLITADDSAAAAAPLGGRRARIVYRLTDAGRDHLDRALATAEPAAWDDDAFDVRFTLFASTDAATRLRILEGRRARMVERMENLRQSVGRSSRLLDDYTRELARHGLEQVEREVEWLERVIDTERGTRGALDYAAARPGGSAGSGWPASGVPAGSPRPGVDAPAGPAAHMRPEEGSGPPSAADGSRTSRPTSPTADAAGAAAQKE